jgi:16S rRNA G966 N2-methylase RsmD
MDPPFGEGMIGRMIPMAARLLAPTGLMYVESEAPLDADGMAAHGLTKFRADKAGAVHYHLLQFSASQGAQDANRGLSGHI